MNATIYTLTKGTICTRHDRASIELVGWTDGDGTGHEGYCVEYYFDAEGRYLGADEHGIEPEFCDA